MLNKKQLYILPLLLTFLGYCGDDKSQKTDNWLSTSDLENLVAPAGLSASCHSAGNIKVEWDANADTIATHLEIERKSATESFSKIADVAVDEGIFIDAVANGIAYTYRVKAIVKNGDDIQYISDEYSVEATGQTSGLGCGIVVDPDEPSETQSMPDFPT